MWEKSSRWEESFLPERKRSLWRQEMKICLLHFSNLNNPLSLNFNWDLGYVGLWYFLSFLSLSQVEQTVLISWTEQTQGEREREEIEREKESEISWQYPLFLHRSKSLAIFSQTSLAFIRSGATKTSFVKPDIQSQTPDPSSVLQFSAANFLQLDSLDGGQR